MEVRMRVAGTYLLLLVSMLIAGCDPNAGKTPYKLHVQLEITPGPEADGGGEKCFTTARNEIIKRFTALGVGENNVIIERKGNVLDIIVLGAYAIPEDVAAYRNFFLFPESYQVWETYNNEDFFKYLSYLNSSFGPDDELRLDGEATSDTNSPTPSAFSLTEGDTASHGTVSSAGDNALLNMLHPNIDASNQLAEGPVVGISNILDTATVMTILRKGIQDSVLPQTLVLKWGENSGAAYGKREFISLYALRRSTPEHPHAIDGTGIASSNIEKSEYGGYVINFQYNDGQSKSWEIITGKNSGKYLAMVLDNFVVMSPVVQSKIEGGKSVITGNFSEFAAKSISVFLGSAMLKGTSKVLSFEYEVQKN